MPPSILILYCTDLLGGMNRTAFYSTLCPRVRRKGKYLVLIFLTRIIVLARLEE